MSAKMLTSDGIQKRMHLDKSIPYLRIDLESLYTPGNFWKCGFNKIWNYN